MIKKPGIQCSRMQQLMLAQILKRGVFDQVVVHHITEDTAHRLQLEVEIRSAITGITFERIVL